MSGDTVRPRRKCDIREDISRACPSVLVVDDCKFMRRTINGLLKGLYIEIVEANDGRHALELIESRHFDLVLLDIMIPYVDGLEVARRLRANPQTRDLPIVFCSGIRDPKCIDEAKQLDNVDYLVKPLNGHALLEKIDNFLCGWRASDAEENEEIEDVLA